MLTGSSSFPGFRALSVEERRRRIAEIAGLEGGALTRALETGGLDEGGAEQMVEDALGRLAVPFGVGLHFRINGRDFLAPMVIEEPSVIAAASHAAKRIRAGGGFMAETDPSIMIAQIEVHGVRDAARALTRLREATAELIAAANRAIPSLVERGGGARDLAVRDLGEGFVVTHVHVDCCDAMGANTVNTVAEALGDRVAELADGELGLRILSNYCDRRCTRVTARVPVAAFGDDTTDGPEAARGVALASRFAELDPYRAATHNKGIMNGVDAVVLATGNDWRAVEAGAHAFAARSGRYAPLATWRLVDEGTQLEGRIELPMALGTVGGALRAHDGARLALAMSGADNAAELGQLAAAAGLACNLAALRALATEGIQKGHMALHRRALAEPCGPVAP